MKTNITILHDIESGNDVYGKLIGSCEYTDFKHDWSYTLYLFSDLNGGYYQNYNNTKYVKPASNVKHILKRIKSENALRRKHLSKHRSLSRNACRRDYNSMLENPFISF